MRPNCVQGERQRRPRQLLKDSSCILGVGSLYSASFLESENIMRRPKGIKTKKSVAKRFKITANGKVMRRHAGKRHLLQTKGPRRRRRLCSAKLVDATDTYRITQSLPFSH